MNIRSGSGWTIFVFGPEAQNNQMMRILSPDYGPNLESGGLSTPFISGNYVFSFFFYKYLLQYKCKINIQ